MIKLQMRILTVQNRMGIGDMVIFLPFIQTISKKFGVPVSILVKENSKAIQFLENNPAIDQIIILDRNNKIKNGRHDGFIGSYNLAKDIKKLLKFNDEAIFIKFIVSLKEFRPIPIKYLSLCLLSVSLFNKPIFSLTEINWACPVLPKIATP